MKEEERAMNLWSIKSREWAAFSQNIDIFSGLGYFFQVCSYKIDSDFQVWGINLKKKGLPESGCRVSCFKTVAKNANLKNLKAVFGVSPLRTDNKTQ